MVNEEYIEAIYYYKAMYNGPRDDEDEGVFLKENYLVLINFWDGRAREQEYQILSGDKVIEELEIALKGPRSIDSETDYRSIKKINLPKIIKDYDLNQKMDYNFVFRNKIDIGDLIDSVIEVARGLKNKD